MSVLTSRPVLRWALPAGLVAVVLGGGALVTTMQASADVRLPPRSAAQLLVDVQTARLEGVSGTVVERADLGLIALPPGIGGGAAGSSGIDLASLISGSNTMRVWYSGKDKARVALIRSNGESDIVHNGTDTWLWNSRDNTATHYQESDKDARPHPEAAPSGLPADLPKTPQEAADRVLAALDPTTVVTTDSNALVAKHKAYQLVLRPRDTASLVAEVRIAIDGDAHVPIQLQVFAKGDPDKAAFEIGFTQVSFTRPDDGVFRFTPPPGAKITEGDTDKDDGVFAFNPPPGAKVTEGSDKAGADKAGAPGGTRELKPGNVTKPAGPAAEPKSTVIGKGWTAVLVTRLPQDANAPKDDRAAAMQGLLGRLPQVHGAFGTGRVLSAKLFTVLLLDDGRVLVGAVNQDALISAASNPAAALK